MKIVVVGGGPAGLYFGILMGRAGHSVDIYERNRPGDTFGWGVVFSDATLDIFAETDPVSHKQIQQNFAYWNDIETWYQGTMTRSTGHGFCGLARVKLLEILTARAREVGCRLHFEAEVDDLHGFADADLILAADGVNSRLRTQYADHFQPNIDWRKCRFAWLGLSCRLPAFTFLFRENEHGLHQVHAYPFDDHTSTFIVECHEDVWRRAGLDQADQATTVAYYERLFAQDLRGGRLMAQKVLWRSFPTIRNAHWSHKNIVLMGDAAHTAHFSIGSGTKLAMEDAIALAQAFADHPQMAVPEVLVRYEAARRPEVDRLQTAAQTSLEWFENAGRYQHFDPLTFNFSLMTRSKRITWDELSRRDVALMAAVATHWSEKHDGATIPAFTPYTIRDLTLPNRLVVSPMCQYTAVDGAPGDWHLVHLGSRAVGGAGLIMTEATAISPEGRITPGCTGLYSRAHVDAWRRIVDFVHAHSKGAIGIQLGHAGRKGACQRPWEEGGAPLEIGAWPLLAPTALAWDSRSQVPREMSHADIQAAIADMVRSVEMAKEAGFDLIELHFAHGYLYSSFLSALTNHRTDSYGGSLENRARFSVETLDAVRRVWDGPLSVRISATEWAEGGLSDADRVRLAQLLTEHGADIIDVSAGGVVPHQKPVYGRMFQVPFSDLIRNVARVPTMTVGNIQDVDQCNTILAAGRADLCVMARGHLYDPYFALHAAARYNQPAPWPVQYAAVSRFRPGTP